MPTMTHSAVFRLVTRLPALLLLLLTSALAGDSSAPIAPADLVFAEHEGLVAVEAEHFVSQEHASVRAFHITSSKSAPQIRPDGDPPHVAGASGGACVEVLPDSRRNHGETLIAGENFSNQPGKLAVLTYPVHFSNPGRYYVWVRAHSTGTEDNGLHVGIDGTWPESGQRLQWCDGKRQWWWESKQRTAEQHCGEPHKIFLDVPSAGVHTIQFSMREDGFEFDRWLMTVDREFVRPEGVGPECHVHRGTLPQPFPWVEPAVAATDPSPEPESDPISAAPLVLPRQPDGDGSVVISGELKQWHKVTLTQQGPWAHEADNDPNPFVNYEMTVEFRHESGQPVYIVPGYFAADGDAANTSAESGTSWRAHLSPDKPGRWDYRISFRRGLGVVQTDYPVFEPVTVCDGVTGSFQVAPTDKRGSDFRARGRRQYVGRRYLQFAGSGELFLKAGPDAPETLLAFRDFDGTVAGNDKAPLKDWQPHVRDWESGDPTWGDGRGRGLIGAINYLASKGCNTVSFLPYNAGGDGDNVWPFRTRNDKRHYDCSRLDQWGIVFDHATRNGIHLHFKLQENEMDDNRRGAGREPGDIPESLDGGKLGPERRLYIRELVARFAHALALNWNLGEENTQSTDEHIAMIGFIRRMDPYHHNVVVHTFPPQQDAVYTPLLGEHSGLTGASLQNGWNQAHQRTLKWVRESQAAGHPWVVCNDEQGPASHGVPPDPGYQGHSGIAREGQNGYTLHDIRKHTLWGTLMAGGAGVEYYFGYQMPENDLLCEDFRSRDRTWDYCRIALDFFRDHRIPLNDMSCHDELIGNPGNSNSRYCFAQPGTLYLVYLPDGGTTHLDLTDAPGEFAVHWFNPRVGGPLLAGTVAAVSGGKSVSLGQPPGDPDDDWLAIVRAR